MEKGYQEQDEEVRLRENKKKDSKALLFVQQAVHESIFSRIAAAPTSQQVWSILQEEFQGSSKVIVVKLQMLRQEFETMSMKNNEAVQEYVSRIVAVINQIRALGDTGSD